MDYLYIRAWNQRLGSSSTWCEAILHKARQDNAPTDAIYSTRGIRRGGEWRTRSMVRDQDQAATLDRIVAALL